MDKYIVATIHPFILGQEVMIYIDNKCTQIVETTLDNMCDTIINLCEKYNIYKVNFFGGQLYSIKFKDRLVAHKFKNNKNIEVHIQ